MRLTSDKRASTLPAPCTPEAPRTPGSVTSTLQRGVISIEGYHLYRGVSSLYCCYTGVSQNIAYGKSLLLSDGFGCSVGSLSQFTIALAHSGWS